MKLQSKIQPEQSTLPHHLYRLKRSTLACVIAFSLGFSSFNTIAAPVAWAPDADGNWEDVTNWDSNPVLPGSVDDITIDVGGATVRTISLNSGRSANTLINQENLDIVSGSLTLTNGGTQNGSLSMGTNTVLTVNGGVLNVNGSANIDGANVLADGGSSLNLSTVGSYITDTGSNSNRSLQARNASTLDLSGISTLAGGGFIRTLIINSSSNSHIDLSSLTDITAGATSIHADGASSTIDLSSLSSFQDSNINRASILKASNGATINSSSLQNTNAVDYMIDGAGSSVDTSNVTDLTNGTVRVQNGGNTSLASLTNADGSSFIVSDGVTLDISSLLAYDLNAGGNNNRTFNANGASSKLDVSGLTTAVAGGFIRTWLVNTQAGGVIDMSNLSSITNGAGQFVADGAGSLIDLSSLTLFNDDNGNRGSTLEATNGAEVRLSSSGLDNISLSGVNVVLNDDGSTLNTDRIVSYEKGVFTSNGVNRMLNISSSDGSSFIANDAVLDINNVVGHVDNPLGNFGNITYRADGSAARINMTAVTSITNESAVGPSIDIQADNGGYVDLRNVSSIEAVPVIINASAPVRIAADGAGSHINLSSLSEFKDRASRTDSVITATNGGSIELNNSGTTTLTNINVSIDQTSSITADTVELVSLLTNTSGNPIDDDITTLAGSGNYSFNVLNTSGVVTPGNSQGDLIIDGNYSEGTQARIDIELFGVSDFDTLSITGNASFAGTLNVLMDLNFDLETGMSFDVIDIAGSRSGGFLNMEQGAVVLTDNGIDLFIDYNGGTGNDILLTTIMPSAVPLPASLPLMFAGLGLLWKLGRKKS